jgi:hypothetical protein
MRCDQLRWSYADGMGISGVLMQSHATVCFQAQCRRHSNPLFVLSGHLDLDLGPFSCAFVFVHARQQNDPATGNDLLLEPAMNKAFSDLGVGDPMPDRTRAH